ncbi:MAG TPA: hypothetical protein ENI32_03125 [Candidatus Syntrophoarchaeum butanivorans]|uniref:A-type ATP synthase subunit C n=1 Tax=Candidatus Syntropharchaeum butanivorans TaxID=1839936 RepID=A0A1F2P4U0_9EURY|nr:MAG: V-type ATP synthase, subunit C [Candidatus Syntrophoarchaeum butanivorans]HEC56862.1 hypothetical protein [Candidatus Syntrophoarchaeum butanivorans]
MSVSEYAYINAKVRVKKGELLDLKRIRSLMEASTTREMVSLLMDTTYREELSGLPPDATIVEIERAMLENMVRTFMSITISLGTEAGRMLCMELLRRFEVLNLKNVLRAKLAGMSEEELVLFPVESLFKRRLSRLIDLASIEEMIPLLEGTVYKEILEANLPAFRDTGKLFILESALDAELFRSIWMRAKKLGGNDGVIAMKMLGAKFDMLNIMTVLRGKVDRIDLSQLREYILPYGRINPDLMRDAMMADDVKSTLQVLSATPYGPLLTGAVAEYDETGRLSVFEMALEREILDEARSLMMGYPFQIGTILGFFELKESEVKNLRAIAVCKENNLPAEEIRRFII